MDANTAKQLGEIAAEMSAIDDAIANLHKYRTMNAVVTGNVEVKAPDSEPQIIVLAPLSLDATNQLTTALEAIYVAQKAALQASLTAIVSGS